MQKNIFNINPSEPFLTRLAIWILSKYPDPLYLSSITVLLPSRRACGELKNVFLKLSENQAMILPKILAIGDVDYDDLNLENSSVLQKQSKVDYSLELILAIKDWNQKTHLFGKNISTASLTTVAQNLQSFLDEVQKEGLDLNDLTQIDDGEMAAHKQQILQFLQYFGSIWQNSLLKKGLIWESKRQNLMLENFANNLQKNGSEFPIIAAGSTGSVFAASKLLKTISKLENGFVILFGLDKNLDEKIWEKIGENHPQYILKKLLARMEVFRGEVVNIGESGFCEYLSSLVMLPAEFCEGWRQDSRDSDVINHHPDSVSWQGVNSGQDLISPAPITQRKYLKIETENEFDEAKIIAFQLREVLEEKNKTAVLISNDKNLNQLVKANLLQWKIEIDDSSSSNLAESEIVNFLFLISRFAKNDFSGSNILSILKHKLSIFKSDLLRVLEEDMLRNVVKFTDFDDLILRTKDADLKKWLSKISDIFQPFVKEFKKEKVDFGKIVQLHFECFERLTLESLGREILSQAQDDKNAAHESWKSAQGGAELSEFINEIKDSKTNLEIESESYNRILQNFLKNYQYRKIGNFHPRLHILSTMEARLMSFDLTIVAGLYEGNFPSGSSDDWLGSKIRSEIGMPTKSRKIGVEAYDFCNYLGSKKLVLLYPKSQNNSPSIKSRFLLKLETVLKINGWDSVLQDGEDYLQLLDIEQKTKNKPPRTNPKPEQNLVKISATDISKWVRNPYFIYAKRILKLKPLKKIEQESSFAEFGNFVHKSLEEFVKNYPSIDLIEYGKKIFEDYFPDKSSHLLWWAKFENIAKWFVLNEKNLRKNLQESFVEVEAQGVIQDVILSTKIDRINLYCDGSWEIIDYKTGQLPTIKDITAGIEPQLSVEALILQVGEIKNYPQLNGKIDAQKINNLQYQHLKGNDQNDIRDLKDAQDLLDGAGEGMVRLLKMFKHEAQGYICTPNFDLYKEDDYWHLGRVGE